MADEFRVEEEEQEDEEYLDEDEGSDVEEGLEAAQTRADTADLLKLYKLHQEIFIPYEEEVVQQLATRAPTPGSTEVAPAASSTPYLRDVSKIDSAHTGYPYLTQYERTKCLSFRASQIGHGAKPYVKVPAGMTDSYQIAKLELESKRLPFILRRPLPNGTYEVWKLSDLVLLPA
jgi:DNA-directed RNA polymerase I, II, and III subunit RPABC2